MKFSVLKPVQRARNALRNGKNIKKSNTRRAQVRPTVTSVTKTPLTTQSGLGEYHTQISGDEAFTAGNLDGDYGTLDREIHGENAHPHFLDALAARHGTARNVIGHIFRGDYQAIVAALSLLLPSIKISKERALSAIDAHASALKQELLLLAGFVAAGSPQVKRRSMWLLGLTYLALFAGDWSLIAVGFQVFGLSDSPWIPGVAFTDDLHLAAVSSVAALILLGHFAAGPLRRIEHALRLRHNVIEEERLGVPQPAPFDWTWLAVLLSLAGGLLYALSSIRSTYLTTQGIPANNTAFLLLQIGIFAAALALGLVHQPDPDAEEWQGKLAAVQGAVEVTRDQQTGALSTYIGEVGQYNGEVAHLAAIPAQAGHHVHTDRNDKAVVGSDYYLRTYVTSQPGDHIAQQSILADGYERLPDYNDEALLKVLTGVTPLPTFRLLSTRSVEQHLANRRVEVDRLRIRIDQKEIDAVDLPDFEKPEHESIDSDELADDYFEYGATEQPASEESDDDQGSGGGANSTPPWLVPLQVDEDNILDTEVIHPHDDDQESA